MSELRAIYVQFRVLSVGGSTYDEREHG